MADVGAGDARGPVEGKEESDGDGGILFVVILVGLPGSGKSTFCDSLVRSAGRRRWARVCQDTIGNGRAGTRAQCLKAAEDALMRGRSVLVDRCNLEREQRVDFVNLRRERVEIHAVVLDLPDKRCVSRTANRTGHEGGLQGGRSVVVVNKMRQRKEAPRLSEGFSRIMFCHNDADAKDAVDMYSSLGPLDNLPLGEFGRKSKELVQMGIMRFMKKMDMPSSSPVVDDLSAEASNVSNQCLMDVSKERDDTPTLAFPSISTSDFQFDVFKAADVIVETAAAFLERVPDLRLVLVDISPKSRVLSLVRDKVVAKNINSRRFFTFVGDITKLSSQGGLRCCVIANAANWRLKPGGGGVNAAVYNAAGVDLEIATKERAETLLPGTSVAIPLPSSSPLHQQEGVTHVIHVLGPNMNPQRPNYLNGDYFRGCNVLREAYSSLFDNFASVAQKEMKEAQSDPKNKRGGSHGFDTVKKCKSFASDEVSDHAEHSKQSKREWSKWALGLFEIAMHPERHKDVVLEVSDELLVLNDLYPKARKHVLVLSRIEGVDSLSDVGRDHLPLLRSMHSTGVEWAQKFLSEDCSLSFRLGFHSVPSLRQLHLHVISQDFDSEHLKNKKHWNSFTSEFFRDSVDVIEEIGRTGEEKTRSGGDENKLLGMELRCHRCRSAHPNIPKLKAHLAACRAPFPGYISERNRILSASIL